MKAFLLKKKLFFQLYYLFAIVIEQQEIDKEIHFHQQLIHRFLFVVYLIHLQELD